MRNVGCVIFDSIQLHNCGWACVHGQEPFRIKGTQELPSNVVWVSNLGYNEIIHSGFLDHTRIRTDNYLHEKMEITLSRIGAGNLDPDKKVAIYAAIFARVMTLADGILGIEHPPLRSLGTAIRQRLLPPDVPLEPAVYTALNDAISNWTRCERIVRYDSYQIANYYLPQVTYATERLKIGVPNGNWIEPNHKTIPDRPSQIADWVRSVELPFLAKIVVHEMDDAVNHIINFGSGLGQSERREWVTSPELYWLALFGNVQVNQVFIAEQSTKIPKVDEIIDRFDDAYNLSVSAGLFALNVWTALGRPWAKSFGGQTTINALTPFLRAEDRISCFTAAHSITQNGADVIGYGVGRVSVAQRQETTPVDCAKLAYQNGVVPFTLDVESHLDKEIRSQFSKHTQQDGLSALQSLFVQGDTDKILSVDQHLIGI